MTTLNIKREINHLGFFISMPPMKKSAKLAHKIHTLTYESNTIPDWEEAKSRLETQGKILQW